MLRKSVTIGVHTTSNQLNGIDATKIGYNRRTYNHQPTIGHKCNKNWLQTAYIQLVTHYSVTVKSLTDYFINDSINSLFVSAATEDRVRCPAIPAAEESNRED